MVIAIGFAIIGCGSDDGDSGNRRPSPRKTTAPAESGPCSHGTELYKRQATGAPTVTGCRRPDGSFHGLYSATMADGVKTAEGTFEDGARQGRWIYRHPNGRTWREGDYLAGKLNGKWTQYAESGKLLGEYTFQNGTGTEIKWWDNGQKREQIEQRDGLRHGVTTWWFETGEKMMEATYQDGRLHGDWTFWDRKGQTRKIESWKQGIIGNTVWYEGGEPLTE